MKNKTVAIVGATGAVGREFVGCIESARPAAQVAQAAGFGHAPPVKKQTFRGEELTIEELTEDSLQRRRYRAVLGRQLGISKQFAPIAVKAGAVVVDNSSAFRIDPAMPLVVPEINARRIAGSQGHHRQSQLLGDHRPGAALADPSGTTASKRLIVSTYQAASGGGRGGDGGTELDPPAPIWTARPITPKVLPHPYAFNLFSHNTAIDPATGYNDEETKVIKETQEDLRG